MNFIKKGYIVLFIIFLILFSIYLHNFRFKSNDELKGTLTLSVHYNAKKPLSIIANQFVKKYPKVKVEVDVIDDNIINKLSSNEELPDIIQIDNEKFPLIMDEFHGRFLDLTDTLELYKNNGEFVQAVWPQVIYKDDKIYGFPWDIKPCVLYYRKDIFEDVGIISENIKTWDDYIEAGKKIIKYYNGRVHMLGIDYYRGYELGLMMLNQLGGSFYDSKDKFYLNNNRLVKVMNLQKKMINEKITVNLKDEKKDKINKVKNNKLATVPYSIDFSKELKEKVESQKGKWGIMKLPAFENGGNQTANLGGTVFSVIKNTEENDQLAIEFLKYCLMNNESNNINLKYGFFSAYKPLYNKEIYKDKDEYFHIAINRYFSQVTDIREQKYGKDFKEIISILKNSFYKIRVKNLEPEKVLKEGTKELNDKLKNN